MARSKSNNNYKCELRHIISFEKKDIFPVYTQVSNLKTNVNIVTTELGTVVIPVTWNVIIGDYNFGIDQIQGAELNENHNIYFLQKGTLKYKLGEVIDCDIRLGYNFNCPTVTDTTISNTMFHSYEMIGNNGITYEYYLSRKTGRYIEKHRYGLEFFS